MRRSRRASTTIRIGPSNPYTIVTTKEAGAFTSTPIQIPVSGTLVKILWSLWNYNGGSMSEASAVLSTSPLSSCFTTSPSTLSRVDLGFYQATAAGIIPQQVTFADHFRFRVDRGSFLYQNCLLGVGYRLCSIIFIQPL